MEVKAKCKYDVEAIKALAHLSMFRRENPKKRMMFWTFIFAIIFGIIIFEILLFDADTILLMLMGVEMTWLVILYIWYFIIPKMQYKSLAKMKEIENEYIFYNDKLKAFTRSAEYNGEAEIAYSLFLKVYETTRYLFLYQTNNQVFIVDKSTAEGGTVEEIRSQLSIFLKDKYMLCKY